MQTRYLIIVGFVFSIGFVAVNAYADCDINSDWPEAPCMDQIINGAYPQHQVNKWTEYFHYKGESFMDFKKKEMNNAIKDNKLLEWTEESIQNQNVWRYYYFSGQAPNPYSHLQNVTFEHIEPIPTQMSDTTVFCIEDWKFNGTNCVPDDSSTSYSQQWVIKVILIGVIVGGIAAGVIIAIKLWKRK